MNNKSINAILNLSPEWALNQADKLIAEHILNTGKAPEKITISRKCYALLFLQGKVKLLEPVTGLIIPLYLYVELRVEEETK